MKAKLTKFLCCTTIAAMTGLSLAGCSKKSKGAANSSGNAAGAEGMGRYVETDIPLPEGKTECDYISTDKDGKLVLIGSEQKEESLTFTRFTQAEDTSWEPEVIADFPCEKGKSSYSQIYRTNPNGDEYIYFVSSGNDGICYLYKHNKDSWDPVTIDGWNEYDEENDYHKTPWDIGLLNDGNLIASYDGDVNIYDPATGKLIKTLDYSRETGANDYQFCGNDMLFTQMDLSTYKPKNICRYSYDKDTLTELPIADASDSDTNRYYVEPATSDLYLINTNGIKKYQNDAASWEPVVDGSLTSFYLPNLGVISIAMTPAKDYYALVYMDDERHLLKYTYDTSVPTVPSEELSIYSLEDNALFRQAIVTFQHLHPDVQVTLNSVMAGQENSDPTDFIRALNTSLLAGGGEDILLLDGLPYQSLLEKGVLCDLTDIIQPMVDSGELLSNVMASFKTDNAYYYTPTRMDLIMEYGNGDSGNCTTIDSIIEYAKSHPEHLILGQIKSTDLIQMFIPVYLNSITQEDKTLSKEGITDLFQKLKELFDLSEGVSAITDADKAAELYSSIWDLPSTTTLNISESRGFTDEGFNLAMVDFVKGSFNNFESSFNPSGMAGINKNSKKQDLAKEFIQLILSEEVQSHDLFNGYSVNSKVIDTIIDETAYEAYTEVIDANGNSVPFEIGTPSKEQKQAIIQFCKSAKNCILTDSTVLEKTVSAAEDYLAGNASLEDAVTTLMNEISLYTKE